MTLVVANFAQSLGCNLFLSPNICVPDDITLVAPVDVTTDATALTVNTPHVLYDGVETVTVDDPVGATQGDRIPIFNASLDTIAIQYTDATDASVVTVYCIPPGGNVTLRADNISGGDGVATWKIE